MISPSCDDAIFDMPAEGEGPVEVLLRLAATAGAFRSADGSLYAQVPVGDRQEIYGLKSAQFRDWLIDGYRVDCGKLPKNTAIRRVLAALEARARFDAARRRSSFASATTAWGRGMTSPLTSTWAMPADGPSRSAPGGGRRSIDRASTSVVPKDSCRSRGPAAMVRSSGSFLMSTSTNPTSGC